MSLSPPVVVYPNAVTTPQPSSHSKGSFGPVFIILAVIVVVSIFACCIGQICARRVSRSRKKSRGRQDIHPTDRDVEFGSKKRVPTGKPVSHGDIKEPRGFPHGEPRGFPQGEPKGFPQGEPKGFPHGEPGGFPHGDPRGFPHGEPGGFPQHGDEPRGFHHGEPRPLQHDKPRPYREGERKEVKFAENGNAKARR